VCKNLVHVVQNETDLWSKNRIASELGIDRRTVDKYLKGVAPTGKVRGHPGWSLRDFLVPLAKALDSGITGEVEDPDRLPPKERKDWYQSENERIKMEREQGILIPAEEVRTEMANLVKPITQAMDSLPDVLERDCGLSRETLAKVQDMVDSQRDQLYKALVDE